MLIMEFNQVFPFVFCILFFSSLFLVEGRLFFNYFLQELPKPHFLQLSEISLAPSPAPEAYPPSPTGSPSDSAALFNVLSYGAVGDGVTDDTQAFKMAWDDACHTDSAILLVPHHYSFMIQSTIFTGPCKSGLVFQVTLHSLEVLNFGLTSFDNFLYPPHTLMGSNHVQYCTD